MESFSQATLLRNSSVYVCDHTSAPNLICIFLRCVKSENNKIPSPSIENEMMLMTGCSIVWGRNRDVASKQCICAVVDGGGGGIHGHSLSLL